MKKLKDDRWQQIKNLTSVRYSCGYCGEKVSSSRGYLYSPQGSSNSGNLRICPDCGCPSFFQEKQQWPGFIGGEPVDKVPSPVNDLYEEARRCMSTASYTAVVLIARKLLMHIAVQEGAKENLSFKKYVDWLSENGFTPPNSNDWVDHIRTTGNEANHEINIMSKETAEELLVFCMMLLRFNYEFPNRMKKAAQKSTVAPAEKV